MLSKTDYPQIKEYRYLYNALLLCQNEKQLEAVFDSIRYTFGWNKRGKPGPGQARTAREHPECNLLAQAGKERRRELRGLLDGQNAAKAA